MSKKMNPKIKEKWIVALRSGKYTQATGRLKTVNTADKETKHCCLGVLCELYAEEFPESRWELDGDVRFIPNNNKALQASALLPTPVIEWSGLQHPCGATIKGWKEYAEIDLTGINDVGKSFEEIANLIEEHL